MRSFRHWSATYIINRVNELLYQHSYPDYPWLTKMANSILISWLKDSDIGLEFGSGRSTLWLAKRVSLLTSVEHDKTWYNRVQGILEEQLVSNVKYYLREKGLEDEEAGMTSSYIRIVEDFEQDSLDFVLVDGIYRSSCAYLVIEKIRPGGLLIIDNVNRYLPSNSISPNSRTFYDDPVSDIWAEFQKAMGNWRCIWTSSGVTDTALFFKPYPH